MVIACSVAISFWGKKEVKNDFFKFSDLSSRWDMVLFMKTEDTGGRTDFEGGKSRSEDLKMS